MKTLRVSRILVAGVFVIGAFCMPVQANVTYRFTHIVEPQDGPDELADGAIGEAQLFVDVIDIGGNQVLFDFRNIGPEPCVIKGIYFDDGSLLGLASIINHPGVSFTQNSINPVNPPELPAAQNVVPVFVTTANFLADADNPAGTNKNGVDPYESVGIVFDLQTTPVIKQFSDVLSDLKQRSSSYWSPCRKF